MAAEVTDHDAAFASDDSLRWKIPSFETVVPWRRSHWTRLVMSPPESVPLTVKWLVYGDQVH